MVALAVALGLLAAVLLARSVTAVDGEAIDAAREAARAEASVPPPSSLPTPRADGRVVVRPDGIDGLRLGMSAEEVVAAGFVVERWRNSDGCVRIAPGLADTGPGQGVTGWLYGRQVAAVDVDDRVGDGASFLGPGPGDPLADLQGVEGVLWGRVRVPVPWQEAPQVVDVAWSRPRPDVRVGFTDTTGDGRVDHVRVSTDAAAGCPEAHEAVLEREVHGLPEVGAAGWGRLRLGSTLGEVPHDVQLQDDGVTGEGCELVLSDHEPGLAYVVLRDGVVVAVAVDRGRHEAGFAVGDDPEALRAAVPGLTTSYLGQFWSQGLSVDWQVDGEPVVLSPRREQVLVPGTGASITGPQPVLGTVRVGPGC